MMSLTSELGAQNEPSRAAPALALAHDMDKDGEAGATMLKRRAMSLPELPERRCMFYVQLRQLGLQWLASATPEQTELAYSLLPIATTDGWHSDYRFPLLNLIHRPSNQVNRVHLEQLIDLIVRDDRLQSGLASGDDDRIRRKRTRFDETGRDVIAEAVNLDRVSFDWFWLSVMEMLPLGDIMRGLAQTNRSMFRLCHSDTALKKATSIDMSTLPEWLAFSEQSLLISRLPNLRNVHAHRPVTTNATLIALADHSGASLLRLNFARCSWVSDASVIYLCSRAVNLRVLHLSGCNPAVSDRSLKALSSNCPSLRILNISQCMRVTDQSIGQNIGRLSHLWSLNIAGCRQISDSCLRLLAMQPALRRLNVGFCMTLTNAGFQVFSETKIECGLEFLGMACLSIEPAMVAAIVQRHVATLTDIDVRDCPAIGRVEFSVLKGIKQGLLIQASDYQMPVLTSIHDSLPQVAVKFIEQLFEPWPRIQANFANAFTRIQQYLWPGQ